jgi:hypothetical protein
MSIQQEFGLEPRLIRQALRILVGADTSCAALASELEELQQIGGSNFSLRDSFITLQAAMQQEQELRADTEAELGLLQERVEVLETYTQKLEEVHADLQQEHTALQNAHLLLLQRAEALSQRGSPARSELNFVTHFSLITDSCCTNWNVCLLLQAQLPQSFVEATFFIFTHYFVTHYFAAARSPLMSFGKAAHLRTGGSTGDHTARSAASTEHVSVNAHPSTLQIDVQPVLPLETYSPCWLLQDGELISAIQTMTSEFRQKSSLLVDDASFIHEVRCGCVNLLPYDYHPS